MKPTNTTSEIGTRDLKTAVKSLDTASFRTRFIPTDRNRTFSGGKGRGIERKVRARLSAFRREVDRARPLSFHGGAFHKLDANSILSIAHHQLFRPVVPAARDLLHVYGPDRDNLRDWRRYYRYAWKEKGPNAIIYSSDAEIIRQGKLACNSYAYSGQSSYAIVGAGMFFRPLFGDAMVSVRPYVQWLTSASFTGDLGPVAAATANLGIYVESWADSGGGHYVDRDVWMPVWSQNTHGYLRGLTAGGTATVGDGLTADFLAVSQRKYAIFVYTYLETTAGPQQKKNEYRFVTLDIDATVPFVVVEEKLI